VWKEGHSSHVLPPRAEIERAARQAYDCLTARLTVEALGRERQRQIAEADVEYWTWASELSETLLGPVAGQLAGRRILVVADGALQYLPFPALPEPGRRPPLVPLVVEHEVVSLPSASVMAALRGDSRRRPLPPGVVAVLADPVFEGDDPRMAGVPIEGGSDGERPARRGFPRLIATRHEARSILATAQEGRTLQAMGFDASRATALGPELAR
jgi:CHAT domain-containing protein